MPGERILIVDDTQVNLKLMRALLAGQGYDVLTASSAEEAFGLLEGNRPALVLTDLHLPGMDGLEFTRRIKSDAGLTGVTVVAISAFANEGEKEAARHAGCDACIAKPVDVRAFGRQVREFLERRGAGADVEHAASADPFADSALLPLRSRFLAESASQARQWIADLEGQFPAESAAQAVHQWIGAAGLLGYPEISERARELEAAFRIRPMDSGELRSALKELLRALAARQTEGKPEP